MPKHSGASDSKYANKEKSGSEDPMNYDPQNSGDSASKSGTKLSKRYSPAEGEGPNKPPKSNRGE